DVLGLIALAMAKEVAVVGDHEQVSPYAVGYQTEVIHGLIDEMLEDIPNKQLYDGRTSVYDLARQSFGGTIRLLEHFRCVPDIIQFSNHLCYNGEIRALREASAAKVQPHLICHRVKGKKAPNKVNEVEAQEVAALVAAMCRLSEYEDCTIGVVSMVGTEQALYIDSILRRRLSVSEYQKRRLLCGNASQFQGDERDVMVLSLVDSPSNRPLPRRQREDAMKVFNVAASRS
ncbi:MAG: DEAD/DEAH box helicase, partial [Planctomycetota bacterium]